MPKNRVIYLGVLVLVASVLLWTGAVVLSKLKDIFLWAGGAGILLIVVGLFLEARNGKEALKPGTQAGDPLIGNKSDVPVATEHEQADHQTE